LRRNHGGLRQPVGAAALFLLLGGGTTAAAAPAGSAVREPEITAFRAQADSYVNAAEETANFGTARSLRIDASPLVRSYIRFRIPKHRSELQRVNLLVYSRTRSAVGFRVRVSRGKWREQQLTYDNAPPLEPRAIASGPLRRRAWKAVDVTSLVTFTRNNREISFALSTSALREIELASRENGLTGPRLVLEFEESEDSDERGSPKYPLKG
jgi:acid phosphatase type 7